MPSFTISFANPLTESVTFPTVSFTPVKVSIYEVPALFASSIAPLKSPLKTFLIALPKKPNVSIALEILLVIFSTNASLKSMSACFGFSKTLIKKRPKAASLSVNTPTVAPNMPIILLNLFWPSSELVKAFPKAKIAISKAPIPVPIIAIFIKLRPLVALPTLLVMPCNPDITPPVLESIIPSTPP